MINKYQIIKGSPFLVYHTEKFEIPVDKLGIELLEENIDLLSNPEYQLLPIMNVVDLAQRSIPYQKKPRTRDKILSEVGIDSFYDLTQAYFLVRDHRASQFSSRVRRFIEEKYSEIINLEYNGTDNTNKSIS